MQSFQTTVLSAALFAALAVTAGAAESASTTSEYRSQVATNPRTLAPETRPSIGVPATPSTTTPTSSAGTEGSYSRKGFGPNPDCSSGTIC